MRNLAILILVLLSAVIGRAEKLVFAGLKEGESIVIGYASHGCFHGTERKYVVRGGTPARFEIYELRTATSRDLMYEGPERLVGSGPLTERELLGLDFYLYYLRCELRGGCTTQDDISLGFYRGDVQVSDEHHVDKTCGLSEIHWGEDKKLVYPELDQRHELSEKTFRKIVPPWLIEQRIMKQGEPWEQVADRR